MRGEGGGQAPSQKEVALNKNTFFVIEKSVEDVKQDQHIVPDLLESTLRPSVLVKEELRRILMK